MRELGHLPAPELDHLYQSVQIVLNLPWSIPANLYHAPTASSVRLG
jgi:hypothetical protein